MRVRDEFRQQLTAFQGLYDSSIAYGMRHALVAEASKAEIRTRIEVLKKECDDLEDLISDLENEIKDTVKADEEDRAVLAEEHKKYKEEMALTIYQIKDDMDTCLQNPNIIA